MSEPPNTIQERKVPKAVGSQNYESREFIHSDNHLPPSSAESDWLRVPLLL